MKKAVFITGGTVGSGLACAETFAENGFDVFLTSRDAERAEAAAARICQKTHAFAKGFGLNVGSEQQVKDIFSRIDALDRVVETVVLNSANMGFGSDPSRGQDFWTVPIEEFSQVFETNLVWNFTIIRQAAARMKERGKGAIVFIGSNTAYRAIPHRIAYSASKGGINAMSKALAVDLGPFGIRSNVVLPGTIKTARWAEMGSRQIVNGSLTPIGDISDFSDIANAAYFLGSDAAKNITGAELIVDGGMSCQLYPQLLNELKKRTMTGDKAGGRETQ